MEFFSPNAPYDPTKPPHFFPTAMFYFRLTMLLMASLSALMHFAFILGIWRLCGFGARSAYFVLASIALLGFVFSSSVIVCFLLSIIGLRWNDCIVIWRTSAFMALLFYIAVVTLSVTPYAGVAYVPEHSTFTLLDKLPYSIILVRANDATNYIMMLSSVIAYPSMLFVLKHKLKSSRNFKEEMRLTLQVALSVGLEVMFFLLWEFDSSKGALQVFVVMVSNLWYYNAVTLPYFVINKKFHDEIKRLIFRQDNNRMPV